jgi:hypothetical protein
MCHVTIPCATIRIYCLQPHQAWIC